MTTDTVQCPLVDWYQFKKCTIKTCKNHTSITKHGCLEIDRKKPDGLKYISDAELNLYKMGTHGISTRLVQVHRKAALHSVKAILILREYIEYIGANFTAGGVFKTPEVLLLEQQYPLKVARLGWQNWMWEYLLDEKLWRTFAEKGSGECGEFHIYQLLSIKLSRFEKLLHELNL